MLTVDYICQTCGKKSPDDSDSMVCKCGGFVRGVGGPGICGTRDNFGFKNAFKDDSTGKKIDNWKSWERAGYRNPLETIKDSNVKAGIKRKMDKIKHEKSKGVWNG